MGHGDEQGTGFPDRLGSQWLIMLQFIEMFNVLSSIVLGL